MGFGSPPSLIAHARHARARDCLWRTHPPEPNKQIAIRIIAISIEYAKSIFNCRITQSSIVYPTQTMRVKPTRRVRDEQQMNICWESERAREWGVSHKRAIDNSAGVVIGKKATARESNSLIGRTTRYTARVSGELYGKRYCSSIVHLAKREPELLTIRLSPWIRITKGSPCLVPI